MATQIAGGAWTKLLATKSNGVDANGVATYPAPDENADAILFATGADYEEDLGVTGLNSLGHLGPFEYNSQDYRCSINMNMLVTKDKVYFDKLIPNRADIQVDGSLPNWMLTFMSTVLTGGKKTIYAQFKGCVVASNGQQIQSNAFITSNVRFMAMERVKSGSETGGIGGGG